MNLSTTKQLNDAMAIRSQIDNLEQQLWNIFNDNSGGNAAEKKFTGTKTAARKSKGITPAGRRRLAEAMRARWAARRAAAKKS